jgi:hypothetical protein
MLTPAYALTAAERVLPRLALDFTTAIADPRVATARTGNTATRFNSSGVIEIVNANLPRFDFNPSSLVCLGQLIEEARTNLFLNSLIDGTNLATQSVILTAVTHTLSFYGSGSVDITGGHTATVAGVGDFPNRKTYTFTPSAGSSTFTVTGDVKFAQLEAGAFATSYIPTTLLSVTRNADVVSMTGTNFSDWYNASEGAIAATGQIFGSVGSNRFLEMSDNSDANRMFLYAIGSGPSFGIIENSASQAALTETTVSATSLLTVCGAYKLNSVAMSAGGKTVKTDSSALVPTVTKMTIGARNSGTSVLNGHIKNIRYWPQRLTDAEVQAFSKG